MRVQRLHIVLGVVAVVLIGVYVLLLTTNTKIYNMFSLKKNETIQHISVVNAYGSFQFTLEESLDTIHRGGQAREISLWVVMEPEKARMSQKKALLMVDFLENLAIRRVFEDALPEYGLEDPSLTITFFTNRGNEYQLTIGNPTVSKTQYYASDGKTVYLIDAGMVAQFDASMAAFRDRDIFNIDTEVITAIVYTPQSDNPLKVEQQNGNWYITEPFFSGAREIEIQEFLVSLRGLTIADYVSSNVDISEVGIDETSESLMLTNRQGKSQQFRFGDTVDTYRYVETQGFMYKVYTIDLDMRVLNPDDLIFEAPLKYPIDQVKSFTLTMFQSEENPEVSYHFSADSHALESNYTKVYVKYMSILADGYQKFQPDMYQQVAQCRTELKDGAVITVNLYEYTDDTLYMGFGNNNSYVMDKKRLDNLLYWIIRTGEKSEATS